MDFSEVMDGIDKLIMDDHKDSDYLEFTVYWKQHRKYWKRVFSEDVFKVIDSRYWNKIDNFEIF